MHILSIVIVAVPFNMQCNQFSICTVHWGCSRLEHTGHNSGNNSRIEGIVCRHDLKMHLFSPLNSVRI